jgi:hypothetical protein
LQPRFSAAEHRKYGHVPQHCQQRRQERITWSKHNSRTDQLGGRKGIEYCGHSVGVTPPFPGTLAGYFLTRPELLRPSIARVAGALVGTAATIVTAPFWALTGTPPYYYGYYGCLDGAPLVHVADLAQLDLPIARANVAAGVRTLLVVALRKDDALLGTISIGPTRTPAVLRQGNRLARKLRGAGGHRDGERAADHRDA